MRFCPVLVWPSTNAGEKKKKREKRTIKPTAGLHSPNLTVGESYQQGGKRWRFALGNKALTKEARSSRIRKERTKRDRKEKPARAREKEQLLRGQDRGKEPAQSASWQKSLKRHRKEKTGKPLEGRKETALKPTGGRGRKGPISAVAADYSQLENLEMDRHSPAEVGGRPPKKTLRNTPTRNTDEGEKDRKTKGNKSSCGKTDRQLKIGKKSQRLHRKCASAAKLEKSVSASPPKQPSPQ